MEAHPSKHVPPREDILDAVTANDAEWMIGRPPDDRAEPIRKRAFDAAPALSSSMPAMALASASAGNASETVPETTSTMREVHLQFRSHGTICRGVLYLPGSSDAKLPCIVMAHGFALTHASGLLPFKQAFCDQGYAVFAFDYRSFGESEGEPRHVLIPSREVEDYLSAIAFVRTLNQVDPRRICVWGTSFAGGTATMAAARDGHVQAVIAQCPLMDGLGAMLNFRRYAGFVMLMRLSYHAVVDMARKTLGLSPRYVKAAGHPGEVGIMTSPDCYEGYVPILAVNNPNKVAARISMYLPFHRPVLSASRLKCPALILICDDDMIAPPSDTEIAASRMENATVKHYPLNHFDVYSGRSLDISIRDQLKFLDKWMPIY